MYLKNSYFAANVAAAAHPSTAANKKFGNLGGGALNNDFRQICQLLDREYHQLAQELPFEIAEIAANFANCQHWHN